MEVTVEMIRHVADVARLSLSEDEVERFVPQLKEILEHFEKLQEVDTAGVVPSFQPIRIRDALREDIPQKCLTQEEALVNAEHKKDGYFKGPGAL